MLNAYLSVLDPSLYGCTMLIKNINLRWVLFQSFSTFVFCRLINFFHKILKGCWMLSSHTYQTTDRSYCIQPRSLLQSNSSWYELLPVFEISFETSQPNYSCSRQAFNCSISLIVKLPARISLLFAFYWLEHVAFQIRTSKYFGMHT